jgi:hypothetical protein
MVKYRRRRILKRRKTLTLIPHPRQQAAFKIDPGTHNPSLGRNGPAGKTHHIHSPEKTIFVW